MKRAVKALTLAATLLTSGTLLAQEIQGPPNPYAEETPLELRTPKPLATAAEPAGMSPFTKLGLCGLVTLAGVGFVMKRRRQTPETKREEIRVLSRTSVGVRNEVILIEAAGQKLLIGVTPSSMRTLAMLPLEPILSEATDEELAAAPTGQASLSPNFDRLLASARLVREREANDDVEENFFQDHDDELAEEPPASRPKTRTRAKAKAEPRQISLSIADSDPAEGQVVALARLRKAARR